MLSGILVCGIGARRGRKRDGGTSFPVEALESEANKLLDKSFTRSTHPRQFSYSQQSTAPPSSSPVQLQPTQSTAPHPLHPRQFSYSQQSTAPLKQGSATKTIEYYYNLRRLLKTIKQYSNPNTMKIRHFVNTI